MDKLEFKRRSRLLIALTAVLLVLSLFCLHAQEPPTPPTPPTAATAKSQSRNTSRWQWNDDGWRRSLEINGKAEFNEEYSGVTGLTEGSTLRLEEERNGVLRRLDVSRDGNGALVRRYSVNGNSQTLDNDARKWAADLLLMAVRHGAIDVDNRVKRILVRRGVGGMLEEISGFSNGYTKRIYFQALITNATLRRSDLPKVLEAAATQLSSDYEKASLLKATADVLLGDSASVNALFKTIATIGSDYEHRGTLTALLKRKDLSAEVLGQMLDSASAMSSDYEKATFLLAASDLYTGEGKLRGAFLKAVETIKSDYERGRVLSALLRNKQIG